MSHRACSSIFVHEHRSDLLFYALILFLLPCIQLAVCIPAAADGPWVPCGPWHLYIGSAEMSLLFVQYDKSHNSLQLCSIIGLVTPLSTLPLALGVRHNVTPQQMAYMRTWQCMSIVSCTMMTTAVPCCRFGHTHWYTRSCPVYKRQCISAAADGSQRAPVHLNIGNAGASFSWDVIDPALLTQDIYAAFAMQHGYMRVNATRTTLHIQVSSFDLVLCWEDCKPRHLQGMIMLGSMPPGPLFKSRCPQETFFLY